MRRAPPLLFCLAVCSLASEASAATAITYNYALAEVNDSTDDDYQFKFDLPLAVATATLPDYSSTTTTDNSTDGNSGSFLAAFDQSRSGAVDGYALGETAVRFTPSVAVSYSISGSYMNSAGETYLLVYLYDSTDNVFPFRNIQESFNVAPTFSVGGQDGNYFNYLEGSLTGTLIAGHDYTWDAYAYTRSNVSAESGATASGNISLTVGAVPEPASLAIWSGLIVAAAVVLRRRRRVPAG